MEVLQCEETKVTAKTRNIFLIVQGNMYTPYEYIKAAALETGKQITRFGGGNFIVVDPLVTGPEI